MPELVGKSSYGEYYKGVETWFTTHNIGSLKKFVASYAPRIPECGNTKKNGTPQPVPSDGLVKHDSLGNSHARPCEIWCDNTRVFHHVNCAGKFAGKVPTEIPIDVSTCKASSELVFYWLALHGQPWQIYINCVALDGGDPSSTNSTSTKANIRPKTKKTGAPASIATERSVAGEAGVEGNTAEIPTINKVLGTVAPYKTHQ
ncbi:hypothetical protein PHMEG_00017096 [Phytophthora megakarya]|uniref:Uncharacterized protein n=1 Tax=Phytophthora megakarya TaxID=4795 RepID=A0A225VY85_9STRA|nr:hypothetical protein PHMEG_00017096 [Phytophthora megakarya]